MVKHNLVSKGKYILLKYVRQYIREDLNKCNTITNKR